MTLTAVQTILTITSSIPASAESVLILHPIVRRLDANIVLGIVKTISFLLCNKPITLACV
jgi:hypothetical protein